MITVSMPKDEFDKLIEDARRQGERDGIRKGQRALAECISEILGGDPGNVVIMSDASEEVKDAIGRVRIVRKSFGKVSRA